jgi:hypothetical protein
MDKAYCSEDGIIYTADVLSRLSPNELARKRQLLQCVECFVRAFFRHASFDGRVAHFGARPHAEGCSLAAQDNEHLEDRDGEDVEALHIPNGNIIVDFSFGTPDQPDQVAGSGLVPTQDRTARNFYRPDAHASRRLSSLLRMLIGLPAFRDSRKLIEVYPFGVIAARDFFVPLNAVTSQYYGQFRGFWGLITDAQFTDDGSLWLNSGGRGSVSFCIDYKFVDLMFKRYRIKNLEDFAGANILAFGNLQVSANGKLHVIIQEPEYITLRLLKA